MACDVSEQKCDQVMLALLLGGSEHHQWRLTAVNGTRKWLWASLGEKNLWWASKVQRIKPKFLIRTLMALHGLFPTYPCLVSSSISKPLGDICSMSLDFLKLSLWAFPLLGMCFPPPHASLHFASGDKWSPPSLRLCAHKYPEETFWAIAHYF